MCRWKNYENRSIFSKDMDKSIVSPFFDSRCTSVRLLGTVRPCVGVSIENSHAAEHRRKLQGLCWIPRYLLRHVLREWALLSFHSVCLSVWMSVGHSATYSLPRLIDHNQIWSAGVYLSSDPCKSFWIPYLPYFRCQREKYAKFRLLRILATANVTHRAIWLVSVIVSRPV